MENENAKKVIEKLGLAESLPRRFANINDIPIENMMFVDRKVQQTNNIFEALAKDANVKINLDNCTKIQIEELSDIIKGANSVELYFDNKISKNLVSLIAPQNKGSKSLFKWDNGMSWAYKGNVANSTIKDNVKKAGGNVEGIMRLSIQWNENGNNNNDFEAHCYTPTDHIYHMSKRSRKYSAYLDVDIINPNRELAVENIIFTDASSLDTGTYRFFVRNSNHKGGTDGFRAELEIDGETYYFDCNKNIRDGEDVFLAWVDYNEETRKFEVEINNDFFIGNSVPSVKTWNINQNTFHEVMAIFDSPNYWNGEQHGTKHTFIALKDCINDEAPNGFYNEFLREELYEHRKAFEAIGAMMKVEASNEQLSGVGFSSAQINEFVIRVDRKRLYEITV